MRIRLDNARHVADLLSFMQGAGCIAHHAEAETIEVLPYGRGDAEAAEISALVARWTTSHPDAGPEILWGDGVTVLISRVR